MKTCLDCKWSTVKIMGKVDCNWLHQNDVSKMPPFLSLHDNTAVKIYVGTHGCYPKWVDESTAESCSCFEEKGK